MRPFQSCVEYSSGMGEYLSEFAMISGNNAINPSVPGASRRETIGPGDSFDISMYHGDPAIGPRAVDFRAVAAGHGAGQGVLDPTDAEPGSYGPGSYGQWGKRAFDVVAASLFLASVALLMAVIAAVISLDGGKPFFGHTRVGRNGRKFRCLKFRTMVVDAEARLQKLLREDPEAAAEWAKDFKLRKDPRVTRLGLFLRKSSLDELPQLWNVIRGDMSLVGPRPVTEPEMALYGKDASAYYSVRPGITGLWQVSGRNDVSFQERVDLDREYTENLSLRQDLGVLLRTVSVVLRRTGC